MGLLKSFLLGCMLCMMVFVPGCGGGSTATYHIRQDVDFGFIKRIAVLPMDNLTGDRYAGDVVRQVVISELLASGLADVVVPGEVVAALDKMGPKSISALTTEQLKALGNTLKVQAFVLGSVEKFGEVRVGNVSAPEISITLMLADAGSGSIIWSATRTTGGAGFMARHFGARTDTLSESVLKIVRATLQTLTKY